MTTKSPSNELLSLLAAAREHLNFYRELGVEGVETLWLRTEDLKRREPAGLVRSQTGASTARTVKLASSSEQLPVPIQPVETAKPVAPPKPKNLPQETLFGELAPEPEEDRLAESGETLEEISAQVGNCTRCPLCQSRTNIVHTEGNRQARLMFVGEAPGADEDAQARPFVGRAGQLLTKIIEAIGMSRAEVLIGNVNRCRPPGNRAPTHEEASMCKPYLLREIAVVKPEVIVVLGNTAMKNLLDTKEGITKLRGHFQDFKGIKVMPTFHPAYLLRDPSKKRETWDDLKKVRDYLDSTERKASRG